MYDFIIIPGLPRYLPQLHLGTIFHSLKFKTHKQNPTI